jgi:hypothetical protein
MVLYVLPRRTRRTEKKCNYIVTTEYTAYTENGGEEKGKKVSSIRGREKD